VSLLSALNIVVARGSMHLSEYYRVQDLVQITGLPKSTVYWRLSVKKDIPFVRFGRTILIEKAAWASLLAANSGKEFGRKETTA
jgi:hypothetical protein